MDILASFLPLEGTCVPPPIGSRTQGMVDPLLEADQRDEESLPYLRIADAPVAAATPLTIGPLIASLVGPRALAGPDDESHARCLEWIAELKADYQHLRMDGRRPWPELLEALCSGRPTTGDCDCLYVLRNLSVAGPGCLPGHLLDAPLATQITCAENGRSCALGAVLKPLDDTRQRGTAQPSVSEVARSLAVRNTGGDAVLKSKIATRLLELEACRT